MRSANMFPLTGRTVEWRDMTLYTRAIRRLFVIVTRADMLCLLDGLTMTVVVKILTRLLE